MPEMTIGPIGSVPTTPVPMARQVPAAGQASEESDERVNPLTVPGGPAAAEAALEITTGDPLPWGAAGPEGGTPGARDRADQGGEPGDGVGNGHRRPGVHPGR